MSSNDANDSSTPNGALASYLDELLHSATTRTMDDEPAEASETSAARHVQGSGRVSSSEESTRTTVRQVAGQRVPAPVAVMPKIAPPPLKVAPAPPKTAPQTRTETPTKVAPETTVPQARTKTEQPAPLATPKVKARAAETVQAQRTETEAPTDGGRPQGPTERPEWSRHPFECLLFKVAGLQLAVPLVLLGAIHRIDRELTELPGRPRWFLGMLPLGERNIRVVDTAAWVMPGRYPEGCAENYKLVISLDDSDWGLACDEVAQSFTLNPDDVKWRQGAGKRPWLAGTVIKHMCALIDVGAMATLLARAEQERRLDLN
ncbi:chemotaxis protein CheW [Mangrovitalea sediminis]|uniref:chemotaxis protein CheW n=1 Tax=Mangrovitalea sediminis TaxID=1982043 RepID=UPI001D0CF590|nr:CheW domain-containing protein [Mangrovitalea sediminis]